MEVSESLLVKEWQSSEFEEVEQFYTFSFEEGTTEASCHMADSRLISCQWTITNIEGDQTYKETLHENIFSK